MSTNSGGVESRKRLRQKSNIKLHYETSGFTFSSFFFRFFPLLLSLPLSLIRTQGIPVFFDQILSGYSMIIGKYKENDTNLTITML